MSNPNVSGYGGYGAPPYPYAQAPTMRYPTTVMNGSVSGGFSLTGAGFGVTPGYGTYGLNGAPVSYGGGPSWGGFGGYGMPHQGAPGSFGGYGAPPYPYGQAPTLRYPTTVMNGSVSGGFSLTGAGFGVTPGYGTYGLNGAPVSYGGGPSAGYVGYGMPQ